jgi:hypothetical protein
VVCPRIVSTDVDVLCDKIIGKAELEPLKAPLSSAALLMERGEFRSVPALSPAMC